MRPGDEKRAIEVKGRAGTGDIEVSANEWAKACNMGRDYWLYAVYDCATPNPRLVRVQDPFGESAGQGEGEHVDRSKSNSGGCGEPNMIANRQEMHAANRHTPVGVPIDPLKSVFTKDVLANWKRMAEQSEDLKFRLRVLSACGPYPSDRWRASEIRFYRAWRAAWDVYLYAAFANGMFEGDRGRDIRARLTRIDADDFRSAMAECLSCWFLSGPMGFTVDAIAPGRNGKNLDMVMVLPDDRIGIEVKAPFRDIPPPKSGSGAVCWSGDDSDKIAQCLEAANKQFSDGMRNILVIEPRLRSSLCSDRHDLVKAAFGESSLTFLLNAETGEAGPMEMEFSANGKFFKRTLPNGRPLKSDGFPAYRRISAILCIEERLKEKYPLLNPLVLLDAQRRDEMWAIWNDAREKHLNSENEMRIEHDVIVLHNPYAYCPLPLEMWKQFPQLVPANGHMKWTDGYVNRF